ncbi:hypothetical protein WA158_002741 [Blastocystis sp. Blastoise]
MNIEEVQKTNITNLEKSGWIIVYPIYLSSNITIKDGRRVSQEVGCPNVSIIDLMKALKDLGFEFVVQQKSHPHFFHIQGRAVLRLFDENKQPINPEINSKKVLYSALCKQIKVNREKGSSVAAQGKGGKKKGK